MQINGTRYHGRNGSLTKRGPGRFHSFRTPRGASAKPRLVHKAQTLRAATGAGSLAEHDALAREFGARAANSCPGGLDPEGKTLHCRAWVAAYEHGQETTRNGY